MPRKKRLAPYLAKQREQIFHQIWEERKNNLTMQELGDILNIPLDQFFKVLKKAKRLPSHNKPFRSIRSKKKFKQIDKL